MQWIYWCVLYSHIWVSHYLIPLLVWCSEWELFCHRFIQSWVSICSDSAVEWTVGAANKRFPAWMTSCAGGLDCGICQPSIPLCSITPLHLSPNLSLWSTSTPSTHALLPPLPSILLPSCPLPPTHPPPLTGAWITQCFIRFAGKSSLSPGLQSALPPSSSSSPFLRPSLGTTTHTWVPVDFYLDPEIAPWA